MNYLDLIIGIPIVLAAISGFRNGLIKEVASLVALALGLYFAIYFSDVVAKWLVEYIDIGENWLFIVAFIITFVGVVILVSFIGKLLSKVAAAAALGFINRFFGLIFGVLKGVVIMSALMLLFNMIDDKQKILRSDVKQNSMLWQPVEGVVPYILEKFETMDLDDPSWDDFKKNMRDAKDDVLNV